MAKEICISSTPHETRLAILEDDQLAEIYYERENEYTLAGSIYNGRVTRVLPGMQSAFVDLGLERDAFLYVTDFIELEDQEDSDEVEKAAATGAGQAPREIRHPQGDRNGGRQDERGQRGGQRESQRGGQDGEPRRDARPPAEEAVQSNGSAVAPQPPAPAGRTESPEETNESGGRRWRGRRRRRGGRGPGGPAESPMQSEPVGRAPEVQPASSEFVSPSYATETPAPPAAPRESQTPKPFVLPGESLSKYGGKPAAEPEKPTTQQAAPARPVPTYKPSTLIDAPLEWDGSGLLPGESISRHRGRQAEPALEPTAESAIAGTEETGISADPNLSSEPVAEFAHEEIFEDIDESVPPSLHEIEAARQEAGFEFEEEDLEAEPLEPPSDEEPVALEAHAEPVADEEEFEETAQTSEEGEDASATHRVDPSAPTGFRLFGFGKKKDVDAEEISKPVATAPPTSTYAPGQGHVEEEVIEGEEFDSTRRRLAVTRLKFTTWTITKKRRLPARLAPGNWVRCCRKRTSTTASR